MVILEPFLVYLESICASDMSHVLSTEREGGYYIPKLTLGLTFVKKKAAAALPSFFLSFFLSFFCTRYVTHFIGRCCCRCVPDNRKWSRRKKTFLSPPLPLNALVTHQDPLWIFFLCVLMACHESLLPTNTRSRISNTED